MAANLTQITEVIGNVNYTFDEIQTTDILRTSIETSNASSGGWLGLTILAICSISIIAFFIVYQNKFQLFNSLPLLLGMYTVIMDIMVYMLIWGILVHIQFFFFALTVYFILLFINFMRIEINSLDT